MLIKKIISVIFFTILFSFSAYCAENGDISAYSAIVINADTNEILYEKDAYKKRSMASTTKIMTSILAIESGKLSREVTVVPEALAEGSSMGLKKGYKLTLDSLLYGMLLESGNDAANVCALYLGGSFDRFADMMNDKAEEIGMTDTNFVTPSGLDAENHYSTAYDMAILGAYCVKNPLFRYVCSRESKSVQVIEPEMTLNFKNHNRLLSSCEGVFGIKTGFTKKSGRCLVTACERDGATLICVTLNAGDDWNDHIRLYDWCFADLNKAEINPIDFDKIKIYGSDKESIKIYCDDYTHFYKNSSEKVESTIYLNKLIYAPINENDIVGKVIFKAGNKYIGTSYIRASENAHSSEITYKEKISLLTRIKNIFKDWKE